MILLVAGKPTGKCKPTLPIKVKMVPATGYTPQGSKATDFAEVHEITENGRTLKDLAEFQF
jgi:hypothetical protein